MQQKYRTRKYDTLTSCRYQSTGSSNWCH